MTITFRTEYAGLSLEAVGEGVQRRVLPRLIAVLAERAEEVMRERAPRRTGRLASSIRRDVHPLEAVVGPTAPYAIYVEYGTGPHEIRPVHARALRFEIEGRVVFATRVSHPGTRPQPFIHETAEKVKEIIPEKFEEIWRREFR